MELVERWREFYGQLRTVVQKVTVTLAVFKQKTWAWGRNGDDVQGRCEDKVGAAHVAAHGLFAQGGVLEAGRSTEAVEVKTAMQNMMKNWISSSSVGALGDFFEKRIL